MVKMQPLSAKDKALYLRKRRCQAMKRVVNEITGCSVLIECDLITDKGHELCPLHELERGPVDAVVNQSVESPPSGANKMNGGKCDEKEEGQQTSASSGSTSDAATKENG